MGVLIFWAGLLLMVGGFNGYRWGWARGKAAGNEAHQRCHAAAAALNKQVLDRIMEHAQFEAWEEEL